jgi:putative ABC transport system permease protein
MKSYFQFLLRNKLYSFVEVVGLSVALGFVILLMSYAGTEFSVGNRQPKAKEIYAIGMGNCVGMTLGTAEEFFPSIPEIKTWTRVGAYGDADIMVGEDYYSVKAVALDTNFCQLFDYRITGCDENRILAGESDALVSESFARKAFGGDDPVGKTFSMSGKTYTVTGTIEDFGPYDEFKHYDIFLSMKMMSGIYQRMDNFGMVHTFLTLADGADPDAVAEKLLDKYIAYWGDWYHRDGSDGAFIYGSTLTRFDKLYFTDLNSYAPLRRGDRKVVEILLLVALVLLVSAIFNYINLTVAQTGKRAKEMATRRLLGESAKDIIFRYIAESFVFTAGCFVIGCLLAVGLKGWFGELLDTTVVLSVDAASITAGLGLLVVISLLSALLPAAMISKFKPVDVVKGDFRLRNKLVFSKIFIVCQNVISTVLIAVSLTMLLQMNHMVNLPTGYETKDLLNVSTHSLGWGNTAANQALYARVSKLPQVQQIGCYAAPPFGCGSNGVHIENENLSWLRLVMIDSTAFRMFGFKVVEQYYEPVAGESCWIAEETKQRYGVSAEKPYFGDNEENKVCGIIENFRVNDALDEPMEDSHSAVMIRDAKEACFGLVLKTTGDHKEAIEAVRGAWIETAKEYLGVPSEPEDLMYVDDFLNDALTGKRNTMTLVMTFMLLAILISALGLLAMAIYYTGQQSREIALRKIFGSGVNEAAAKLSKSFIVMTLAAVIIAVPISWWAMNLYLNDFYNRIAFPWWAIPAAALLTCLISFLSIVTQTLKTAHANPVDTLNQQE